MKTSHNPWQSELGSYFDTQRNGFDMVEDSLSRKGNARLAKVAAKREVARQRHLRGAGSWSHKYRTTYAVHSLPKSRTADLMSRVRKIASVLGGRDKLQDITAYFDEWVQ